jgi:integrase
MSGKHAKILNDHQLNCLLIFACNTRNPIRDKLIVLLSVKAGLRAGEIAKLTWDMVLDPTGEIGDVVELRDCAAKKKSGRLIPINPTLRAALMAWREVTTGAGPIIVSERGNAMRPVSIVNWFAAGPRDERAPARMRRAAVEPNCPVSARLVHKARALLVAEPDTRCGKRDHRKLDAVPVHLLKRLLGRPLEPSGTDKPATRRRDPIAVFVQIEWRYNVMMDVDQADVGAVCSVYCHVR